MANDNTRGSNPDDDNFAARSPALAPQEQAKGKAQGEGAAHAQTQGKNQPGTSKTVSANKQAEAQSSRSQTVAKSDGSQTDANQSGAGNNQSANRTRK